jgi:anthraniloyl-CoA monooxygenase
VRVACIGGGPAGLYLGILLARAKAGHEVDVFERNAPDDTFGFGVVFSDQTLDRLQSADPESYRAITESFAHWDDIDITTQKGEVFTSKGHGFSGMSRKKLLEILTARALELGVRVHHHHEITDFDKLRTEYDLVMAADGVNSAVRQRYAAELQPEVSARPNRFVWLGSTFPFEAFTFWFKEDQHGLWRVHAYRYDDQHSTFILECTEATWRAAGMARATEAETIAFAEKLFAEELRGHPLIGNRSIWRAFPVIRLGRWAFDNLVVLGDACHTAHYSIGSGTKLAMEDSISLYEHLVRAPDVRSALAAYQAERKPVVDSTQRSAQVSLEWFEETERYWRTLEPLQFAFSLLTRSLRVTHSNLRLRDPVFVDKVDRDYADRAFAAASRLEPTSAPPPMFTPLKLRELTLENRVVVSPMCQYSAEDGTIDDWHLVHLGSRAIGGAGLVITEMTDVSPTAASRPAARACTRRPTCRPGSVWWTSCTRTPAKIGVQLAHAGRKGSTKRLWEGMDQPLDHGNWPLIAPRRCPTRRARRCRAR